MPLLLIGCPSNLNLWYMYNLFLLCMRYENSPLPPANCTPFLPLHPAKINQENATGLRELFFLDILLVQSFGGLEGIFDCFGFCFFSLPLPKSTMLAALQKTKFYVQCFAIIMNANQENPKQQGQNSECTITTAVYNREQVLPHQWHYSSGESSAMVNIRRFLPTS